MVEKMNTDNAAKAWLILNDKDTIQEKMLELLQNLFSDTNPDGYHNREMFMQIMSRTDAAKQAIHNAAMGASMQTWLADGIRRTLETAQVSIVNDLNTYNPTFAIRFQTAYTGAYFTVYPKVFKS
jgi:hypothetical protein